VKNIKHKNGKKENCFQFKKERIRKDKKEENGRKIDTNEEENIKEERVDE
jgi:hypothetical protein